MVLYWYIFGIVALLSLQSSVFQRRSLTSIGNFTFNGICIFLFIVLGFRYRVGGDWNTYQEYNADHLGLPFSSVYSPGNDPGYNFFNWLGANFLGGVILPNLVMAAIFIFGVHRFCLTLPRPFLGLLVSLPFLVWVVGAGYTRQAAALGLFLVALCYVRSGNVFGYLTFAGLSILFHKTAVGLLPFGLFLVPRLFSVRALSVALLFITVTGLLFYGFISANIHMLLKYLEHEYTSYGTTPRMVIIGLCALIFISLNSRFNIYLTEKRFWYVFSSAGLFIILISLSSISSTPFDRILLYWLPLKMYLLAHLPSAFSQDVGNSRELIIISIILFAASMQFVWFSYSPNAYAWSPYLFFPWEIVWGDA
ncbi:MAG: EpsG family protein [Halieaceae bacterium]|nr:EpsG family protein [Halieaceae bacterium]